MSLLVRGSRKNPRAAVPDANAHTLDGSTEPKSLWPLPLMWQPPSSEGQTPEDLIMGTISRMEGYVDKR
jgi:hypothetical protein